MRWYLHESSSYRGLRHGLCGLLEVVAIHREPLVLSRLSSLYQICWYPRKNIPFRNLNRQTWLNCYASAKKESIQLYNKGYLRKCRYESHELSGCQSLSYPIGIELVAAANQDIALQSKVSIGFLFFKRGRQKCTFCYLPCRQNEHNASTVRLGRTADYSNAPVKNLQLNSCDRNKSLPISLALSYRQSPLRYKVVPWSRQSTWRVQILSQDWAQDLRI